MEAIFNTHIHWSELEMLMSELRQFRVMDVVVAKDELQAEVSFIVYDINTVARGLTLLEILRGVEEKLDIKIDFVEDDLDNPIFILKEALS